MGCSSPGCYCGPVHLGVARRHRVVHGPERLRRDRRLTDVPRQAFLPVNLLLQWGHRLSVVGTLAPFYAYELRALLQWGHRLSVVRTA